MFVCQDGDSEIDALYYIWIRVRIEETVYQIKQGSRIRIRGSK